MNTTLYPLLFKPVYQDYIWGGNRIIRRFNRDAPPGIYAESWEVSDRPEGMSVVANGPLQGTPLADLLAEREAEILGRASVGGRFPLLIKLIDARETLSVQVHPDDDTARAHGGEAKTEMWYVLDAVPDACVYAGLKPGVNETTFRQAVQDATMETLLNVIPVQAGDTIFMPGGRVHAIGAGCLLLEAQQNSNTTYRLYDWGRVGANGVPRELHIEQAIKVMRWHDEGSAKIEPRRLGQIGRNEVWELLRCPYFRMERLEIREPWPSANDGHSFHVCFNPRQAITVEHHGEPVRVEPGDTCLIPACLHEYTLCPQETDATVMRITCPGPRPT